MTEIPLNPHPNIILIMTDDIGWGDAGFQSGNQQAFIDDRDKIYSSTRAESFELYYIVNDPEESSDLSLEFPEIKDTLMNQFNV